MRMVNFLKSSIFLLLLVGCYTPKKAEQQLNRAKQYPEKVADFCQLNFPVQAKTDTTVQTEYDWIEVECPVAEIIPASDPIKVHDTIIRYVTKRVQVPGKTITITTMVKDSAETSKLQLELQAWKEKTTQAESKASSNMKFNWILLLLLGLTILLLIFRKK